MLGALAGQLLLADRDFGAGFKLFFPPKLCQVLARSVGALRGGGGAPTRALAYSATALIPPDQLVMEGLGVWGSGDGSVEAQVLEAPAAGCPD